MSMQPRFGSATGRLLLAIPVIAVVIATGCRGFEFERGPMSTVLAFTPWFALLGGVLMIAAVLLRAPESIAVLLVCLAFQAVWLAPLFHAAPHIDQPSRQLVVMASNLREGMGDPGDVVAVVRQRQVDLLTLEELPVKAVEALRRAGLNEELRYHTDLAGEDAVKGSGLWSRFPITGAELLAGHATNNIKATVAIAGQAVTVVVAHPASPRLTNHSATDRELTLLGEQLEQLAGPVIVGGDFNSTRDQRGFRKIEGFGYVDAATQAGVGLLFTWPNGATWVPRIGNTWSPLPLVAIDHVLTRDAGLTSTSLATYPIRGSDHLAIVAVLAA